jgi:hypothetical protein
MHWDVQAVCLLSDENINSICRIRGSHSGGYEMFDLLGYNAVSTSTLCMLPASL